MPDWKADLRRLLARLHFVPARETEVIDELSEHLEDRWKELVADGMTPDQATAAVRAEMVEGDLLSRRLAALRQAHRAESPVVGAPRRRLFADVWQDVRYAFRSFRRQPGFAAAAIVTLALGIGANAAIFSLINATLLQRVLVADPDRLVFVYNRGPGGVFSYPAYADVRDKNEVMSDLIAWGGISASMNVGEDVDLVNGSIVTGNFFDALGIKPEIGRLLQRSDDVTPMGHPVAVISHGLWQRRFGGTPDIVGRQVLLNGQPFSIVGVLGQGFTETQTPSFRDLFVPMMMQPLMRPPRAGYSGEMSPDLLHNPNNGWLFAVGRLKPGVSTEQAAASLTALAVQLDNDRRQGVAPPANAPPPRLPIASFKDGSNLNELVPVAHLLLGVVGAVLLIACANVANLLLSRAVARRREMAIRLAIGASRWRMVRQLLTESVLLSSIGGAIGLGLAWTLVRSLAAAITGALPISIDFSMDLRVLWFAIGVSLLTGVVFGLLPALSASRPALVPALKDGSPVAMVPGRRLRRLGLKRGLVIGQVTLSLLLLITGGLLVRSLAAVQAVNPGFDVDRLLSASLNVNLLRYTRTQGREFYRRAVEDVSGLPGVESAALARVAVGTGGRRSMSAQVEGRGGSGDRFQREGSNTPTQVGESVVANVVSSEYFRTMGIPFVRGRDFATSDVEGGPPVTVINETMAKLWFPGEDPIGRRLSFDGNKGPWVDIIGVVKDSTYASLNEPATTIVYLPLSQRHETGMTLYVRTLVPPASVAGPVRRAVQTLEPNLPMPDVRPVSETMGATLSLAQTGAMLIAGFGVLALVLAAVGIYGVLAFSMTQRQQEFGVRLALGATRGNVFALVIREGLWLVVAGTTIGLVAAAYGTRLLRTFLFGISPTDTWTFVVVSVLLSAVALAACVIPARRATRVDPIGVLKAQ